jgi:PAS domain S-box-containing protein
MTMMKNEGTSEEICRKQQERTKRPAGQKKYKKNRYLSDDLGGLLRIFQIRQIELKLQIKKLQDMNEKARVSLETFEKIYEYAPVGYFTLDKRGVILKTNILGSSFLGAERSQLIGRPIHTFIAPESRSFYFGFFNRLRQGRKKNSCNVELIGNTIPVQIVHLEGQSEWVRTGIEDELHLLMNALDITSQKEAEINLQEMERQYRYIVTNIKDVYFRFGRDGFLISASPSIYNLFRFNNNEKIAGQPFIQFFRYPEDAQFMYDEIKRTGSINEWETDFVRSDGTSLKVSINARFSLDKIGGGCYEGVIHEITEGRKAEQALAEAN